MHLRSKCIEDRCHLCAGCTCTDYDHRWRGRCEVPRIAMSRGQFAARDSELTAAAARAQNYFFSLKPQAVVCFDCVRIDEMCIAAVLGNSHAEPIQIRSESRMGTDLVYDFAHSMEQAWILQVEDTNRNTIAAQLLGLPHESSRVGQGSHGNRAVICRHASKLVASNQSGRSSQLGGAQRRHHACWTSTDDDNVGQRDLCSS